MSPEQYRVLCVDDDTRSLLRALLGMADLEAVAVRDASSALGLMAREQISLYIIDGRLPGDGGIALCEEIRRVDKTTPIVFFNGNAFVADREAGMRAGANAYVAKPNVEELVPTVIRLLQEFRGQPRPE